MSLFQSILRKQFRKLPKILKSVKIIQYYSILFIRVLNVDPDWTRTGVGGHPSFDELLTLLERLKSIRRTLLRLFRCLSARAPVRWASMGVSSHSPCQKKLDSAAKATLRIICRFLRPMGFTTTSCFESHSHLSPHVLSP